MFCQGYVWFFNLLPRLSRRSSYKSRAVSIQLSLRNILWLSLRELLRNFRQHCRYWGFIHVTNNVVKIKLSVYICFLARFFLQSHLICSRFASIRWRSSKTFSHQSRLNDALREISIEREHIFLLTIECDMLKRARWSLDLETRCAG